MSDREVVIKIPEEVYSDIIDGHNIILQVGDSLKVEDVWASDLIRNGTPLPKGHGNLKDFDKIEWYGCTTEFDCPHKDRKCKDCDRAECSKTQVDAIPTIIVSDKGDKILNG